MVKTTKQGCQRLKVRHLGECVVKSVAVLTVLLFACTSLFVVPASALISTPPSGYPSVISPTQLLQSPLPPQYSAVEGLYFTSEQAKSPQLITQARNGWFSPDNIAIDSIPPQVSSGFVTGGWYQSATPYMARFRGNAVVNDRSYYSFNMNLSFRDLPITSEYINFEQIFYTPSCWWEDSSDSVPGEINASVKLRIDTADGSKIGMGYYDEFNIFHNVGTTSVVRSGNDWIRIRCQVPSSQLSLISAFQFSFNGTPETTASMEKSGVVYFDFQFTPLISYSNTFDPYTTTADSVYNLWYQALTGSEKTLAEYKNIFDFHNVNNDGFSFIVSILDIAETTSHDGVSFWQGVFNGIIMSNSLIQTILLVGLAFLGIRAVLGR